MDHFLETFMHPTSVAIVGASRNPYKMNYQLAENLIRLGFPGEVYLVNPSAEKILGKKAYNNVRDIPSEVDLAVIAVPAPVTPGIVKDCIEKDIEKIVLVTGGFSEGGKLGEDLQRKVKDLTRENGIRILGPNTLSPINTSLNFVISFHRVEKCRMSGLSLVFQSGFYEPKINRLLSRVGACKIIDLGNKMDINEVDALEYLAEDPETETIGIHLENIRGSGKRFMKALEKASAEKPTVVLKAGRTSAGSKAAASHTGSMARENDRVLDGVLKQAGAIRARTLEEFWDYTKIFEFLTHPEGNKIAVISMSGGEGVLAMDACESKGFQIADLGENAHQKLEKFFPPWQIPLNPLDAGVCVEFHIEEADAFLETLVAVFDDNNVDCVAMSLFSSVLEKLYHQLPEPEYSKLLDETANIYRKMKQKGKPFALWKFAMSEYEEKLVAKLERDQIPVFPSPERAIDALSALKRHREMQNARPPPTVK